MTGVLVRGRQVDLSLSEVRNPSLTASCTSRSLQYQNFGIASKLQLPPCLTWWLNHLLGTNNVFTRPGNMVAHLIVCNEEYCPHFVRAVLQRAFSGRANSNYCSNDSFAYSTFAPVRLSY